VWLKAKRGSTRETRTRGRWDGKECAWVREGWEGERKGGGGGGAELSPWTPEIYKYRRGAVVRIRTAVVCRANNSSYSPPIYILR
jgi:hypothetical protein